MASALRNLWVGGKLFKSKTDSKPQHVRLKPSNSLMFLSLTDYLTVIILFQGFQMFSKEDHKKRLPVWLLLGRCFNKKLTEKKKKTPKPTKAILKLKLNDLTSVAPQLSRSEAASQTTSSCFRWKNFRPDMFHQNKKAFQTEKLGFSRKRHFKQEFSTFCGNLIPCPIFFPRNSLLAFLV